VELREVTGDNKHDEPSEAKTHLTNITNSEYGTVEAERCAMITVGRIIGLG
jgi:hypothetical protein